MAFNHTVQFIISDSAGTRFSQSPSEDPQTQTSAQVSVPDSTTDQEVLIYVELTNLKTFWLASDQPVTVETNDGSSPDDTISLLANKPIVWMEGMDNPPITADVTALYITNASGNAATVQIMAGWD